MFIRYNESLDFWEYDTSGGQTGAGPWLKLPVDFNQLNNKPPTYTLPSNVAFKDIDNVFSVPQTLPQGSTIRGNNSVFYIVGLSNPPDSRTWRTITYGDGPLHFEAMNDVVSIVQGRISFGRNGDFRAGNTISELGRAAPIGYWTAFTPVLSGPLGPTGGTLTAQYTLIGKTAIIQLGLDAFNLASGGVNELYITIPFTIASGMGRTGVSCNINTAGSWQWAMAYITAGESIIKIYGTWASGTGYAWVIIPIAIA